MYTRTDMNFLKTLKKAQGGDSGDEIPQTESELFSTRGDYGLKFLTDLYDASFDIVFVHGLTGNRETTWTHANGAFWPQSLLPLDIPDARIITFGYDADVLRPTRATGSNTIRDHGKSLAEDLATMRSETNTEERPIIFVAHSLGGLVVEQALLISRGSSELHVKDILEGTFAIVFMGTPHHGSNLASWRIHLSRLSSLIMQTNKKIVRVLEPGSEVLANIQQEFHTMIRDRVQNIQKDVQIFCFYEEKPFRGIGKIVDDHSSILASYPNASIHANHVSMTKFNGPVDAGYVRVKGRLNLWAKTIREAQQKAEGHQKVAEEQPSRKDGQDDEDDDGSRGGNLLEFNGPVSSNGGPIFQGYYRSGRDMVYSNVQKET